MKLWDKISNLEVFKSLRFKNNSVLVTENADGTTSSMAVSELAVLDGLTASTAELNIMDGVTATAAELNRATDISARVVTTTATALSLTLTEHAERIVLVNTNSTVANTFTFPACTGSGAKYTIINNLAQTQGTVVFAANGTDVMQGICAALDSTAAADAMAFLTTATSDKASLNRTTTGGLGQDMLEAWDVAANTLQVRLTINGSGSLATPFSAT